MSESPNGAAREWTPADLRALRAATNRTGIVTVPVFGDDQPPVTLDLSGIGLLTLTGRIPNPLLVERTEVLSIAGDRFQAEPTSPQAVHDLAQAVLDYHDLILTAVVIAPKYYALDEIPPGAQPDDGLTIFDFDAEMRTAIMRVVNLGGDELATFRGDAGASAVVAGSGDLAPGADVGASEPGSVGSRARGRRERPSDAA
jgi:hypothetical protein